MTSIAQSRIKGCIKDIAKKEGLSPQQASYEAVCILCKPPQLFRKECIIERVHAIKL